MEINLDGKSTKTNEKVYGVMEDSYKAILTDISEPYMANKYKSETEQEEKITLNFDVFIEDNQDVTVFVNDEKHTEKLKVVPLNLYCTTRISKGSGDYSNSKLYDVLDKYGLLEQLKKDMKLFDDKPELFVKWLKEKIMHSNVKVAVKNGKESGVSRISTINRVIDCPNFMPVKEEKV
jgi:hypothetical protein